jgi:hypothetical protein
MTTPITHPCPHCGKDYDISYRMHGDRVWCRFCGKWFAVVMRPDGSVYLSKCDAPSAELEAVTEREQAPTPITDEQVKTAIAVLKAYVDGSLATDLCDELDEAIEAAWTELLAHQPPDDDYETPLTQSW